MFTHILVLFYGLDHNFPVPHLFSGFLLKTFTTEQARAFVLLYKSSFDRKDNLLPYYSGEWLSKIWCCPSFALLFVFSPCLLTARDSWVLFRWGNAMCCLFISDHENLGLKYWFWLRQMSGTSKEEMLD